jgi:hypothetical protein
MAETTTTTTTTTTGGSRQTRSATGNSRPRVFEPVEAPSVATKKRGGKTKANTSKPRAKKTATGRVAKPKTTKKKSVGEKVKEKVNGVALKAEGKVEGKPGKKVSYYFCIPVCDIPLRSSNLARLLKKDEANLLVLLQAAGTKKVRGETSGTKKTAPKTKTVKA